MHTKDQLDEAFARRQWRVQRVGWALMLLIILAALVGAFGTSPLAGKVETKESEGGRYEVEYPRISRYQHADRIHLRVHAPQAQGDALKVAFSNEFVEHASLQSSSPGPDGGGASADGAVYEYKVEDWSRPLVVTFEYEPRKAFWLPGHVTLTAGESAPVQLSLAQWIHP